MANEWKKDFNAMLRAPRDMPRIQYVDDPATVEKYGGTRMYFAPPVDYDREMKRVPRGRLTTVGAIRARADRPWQRICGAGCSSGYIEALRPSQHLGSTSRVHAAELPLLQRGRKALHSGIVIAVMLWIGLHR